jgi:uncharacterized protein YndB with AHSA1/START domain
MSLRGYAAFIELPVPPEAAWRWLTEPSLLLRWYAQSVQVELREGGRFTARFANGVSRGALIDQVTAGRRLRLLLDPEPHWPGPAALSEDWLVDARPGRVIVRVLGEGVPDVTVWRAVQRQQQAGWTVALARLRSALAPPPVTPSGGARPVGRGNSP